MAADGTGVMMRAEELCTTLIAQCAGVDARVEGERVVVGVRSTEDVARVLRVANKMGVVVQPRGAGTKLGWSEHVAAQVVLDMRGMDRVLEHTWQDMTCTAQAGCAWAAMQAKLAEHRQFVALDALWPAQATVGGVVAVNDSGALRLKYGGLRDLIIGMTVVLADSTVARTGGRVVKNVAGYDLHKLMTGAFGTLGVITEVTFRLHALPRHVRSYTVRSPDAAGLGKLLLRLLDAQLSLEAVQMRGEDGAFALDVQLGTLPEVLAQQEQRVSTMARALGLVLDESSEDVWGAREQMFARDGWMVVKATMLPSAMPRAASAVQAMGGVSVTQASGVMTAAAPGEAAAHVVALREELERGGGSLTVLRKVKDIDVDRWGRLPDSLGVMREIKRQFDAKGTLNAGCFLGGI